MARVPEPPPRPFLKWAGGKRQLLPRLLEAVEQAGPFRRYHEPFLGGGALFFALARATRLRGIAYLSDVNANLIDAYTGIRDHVGAVVASLRRHAARHCAEHYYAVRAEVPDDPAERAARIVYLNRTCFNGLYRENSRGEFNTPLGRYENPRICDEENLRAVSVALRRARVEPRGFASVARLARRGDLVYFDPPYVPVSRTSDFTAYARGGFNQASQVELADLFARLAERGIRVMLSNSSTELVHGLYQGFFRYEVLANRTVNSNTARRGKVRESLVTSFPLAGRAARA